MVGGPQRDSPEGPSPAGPSPSTNSNSLTKTDTGHTIGRFKLRGQSDDLPQQWWFASTAIPLLAATIGPLANVLSIAALASKWRVTLPNDGQLPEGADDAGVDIPDPLWCTVLNAISLGVGVLGNLALMFNFTKRVRYIIALPLTIIAWYIATGILTGLVVSMEVHVPPIRPGETYSQGFWYAVIASCLYMIGSMILMVNMLGYVLGHYPQHFELDDDQRTLILQTMMFFFWLAGGAAVFAKVCGWSYADALYFCDATILTVGFGDFVSDNNTGRGLVLPYAIFGIIFLGLMIKSIRKFAIGISKDNVIKKHQINARERAASRSVTNEKDLRNRLGLPPPSDVNARKLSYFPMHAAAVTARRKSLEQYGHFDVRGRTVTFHQNRSRGLSRNGTSRPSTPLNGGTTANTEPDEPSKRMLGGRSRRRERLILLREEKDRFDAMRDIQQNTNKFKRYYALSMSILAFGILWCMGAVVFWVAERRMQNMSYFESLYFCYVSLLTIGYGDFSPQSNAGKPFFVVWSLLAVPTMTLLISDMGETVVLAINHGTFTLADWTVLPKKGVVHDFLENHHWLRDWLAQRSEDFQAKTRIKRGFSIQDPDELTSPTEAFPSLPGLQESSSPTERLEQMAEEPLTEHDLARKLALAIKTVANDMRLPHSKKYSYEEWVEFTRLIRFSSESPRQVKEEEEQEGLVQWDWIGENSPMLANVSESEWILDRLCESLNRYTRKQARRARQHPPPPLSPRVHPMHTNYRSRSGSREHDYDHNNNHDHDPHHSKPSSSSPPPPEKMHFNNVDYQRHADHRQASNIAPRTPVLAENPYRIPEVAEEDDLQDIESQK